MPIQLHYAVPSKRFRGRPRRVGRGGEAFHPAAEVLQFAESCRRDKVRRAVVAAHAPAQEALPLDDLYLEAWRRCRGHLVVFLTVRDLLNAVLMWETDPLDTALATFPGLMLESSSSWRRARRGAA